MKALADRIAEAFAERMHQRVRKEFWAYAPDEAISNEELIREEYRGIRPAPGYPAQPDHTEKDTLFRLLEAERRIGVTLTESFAMWPGSSVSGLYLAHPDAHYFGVAKVERDQVEDYAARKGMSVPEVERWLSPILNYEPALLCGDGGGVRRPALHRAAAPRSGRASPRAAPDRARRRSRRARRTRPRPRMAFVDTRDGQPAACAMP